MTDFVKQQYIIVPKKAEPFTTNWFDSENHYNQGDIVINLHSGKYTIDGENWKEFEEDNL